MYDLFARGVDHNTKRVILAGGVWKYLGTSLLPRRLYTGGWKSVDWQVYDNLKQQPKGADLTHQAGHIGLIHTKQVPTPPARILLLILVGGQFRFTWSLKNLKLLELKPIVAQPSIMEHSRLMQ